MVASGRGHLLLPLETWYFAVSARTLLERLDQTGSSWRNAIEADRSPLLVVWGGRETRARSWERLVTALEVPEKRGASIADAGHFYLGKEHLVAEAIAAFVAAVVARTD